MGAIAGAGYVDFELKGKRWGTVSGGVREEVFSGGISVATPSAAASFWVAKKVKLRASVERGFRLPTYVDLVLQRSEYGGESESEAGVGVEC